MMKYLAAMLALGLAAPTAAHPPAAIQAAPDLDRLAGSLLPEGAMLEMAMKMLDGGTPAPGPGTATDIAALYAQNPGMQAYVEAQLRPEMQRVLARELPALRTQIAGILSTALTPSEITEAATFFASPTGQKLYGAAIGSLGTATPGTSEEQARQAAMNAAMASLTTDDYPVLMAFGASGASKKMGTVNPQIGAAAKAWTARMIAQNGDRMRALQLRAAEDFRKSKRSGGQ